MTDDCELLDDDDELTEDCELSPLLLELVTEATVELELLTELLELF